MISIKPYTIESKSIWNAFNAQAKNGLFMFDRDYMDYHKDRFCDNSLMFYDDDKLIALLPLNIKDNVLYSHQGLSFGGFIVDYKMKQSKMIECFEVLMGYMRKHNVWQCIYKSLPYIYHKSPSDEDLYALFRYNAIIKKVECSSTIKLNTQFKLTKGRKAQISRSKREGVDIVKSNDFNNFINLLNKVLADKHNTQATHSAKELALLYSRFPDNISLWCAIYKKDIIAGTLLFIYDNLIHTQYLAANSLAREIGGLDLLIYTLIEKYRNSKMYFDFGISNENNGMHLNEGLISQKESFGARSIAFTSYELKNTVSIEMGG